MGVNQMERGAETRAVGRGLPVRTRRQAVGFGRLTRVEAGDGSGSGLARGFGRRPAGGSGREGRQEMGE